MYLRGEKVIIRSMQKSDLPMVVQWKNDSEIGLMVRGTILQTNINTETRRFEKSQRDFDSIRLTIDQRDGKPIGFIVISELDKLNQKANLGMLIGEKSLWDKGYGTDSLVTLINYLFNDMELNRIGLEVFDYNIRAQKLYEKLGFVKEGIQRQGLFRDGKYSNVIFMGLLKDEYKYNKK